MAQQKQITSHVGDLSDMQILPDRFNVSKLGAMRLVVDKATQVAYQIQAKDAAALCKLLNELDLRGKL